MDERIQREAERRERSHAQHASNRNLADGKGCLKGLAGESVFADRYGLSLDLQPRPGGDAGRDFLLRTNIGTVTVDVKTAEIPRWLLVECSRCKPRTIYVLAALDSLSAVLIGWEWGTTLMRTTPRDYGRRGIISYAIERRRLREMRELDTHVIDFRHGTPRVIP